MRASQARNSSPTPSERNILPIPTSEGKSLQYEGKEGTLIESYDLPDEVKQGLEIALEEEIREGRADPA